MYVGAYMATTPKNTGSHFSQGCLPVALSVEAEKTLDTGEIGFEPDYLEVVDDRADRFRPAIRELSGELASSFDFSGILARN